MKIKGYKLFLESSQDQVVKICKKYGIRNWSLNSEGLVNVDGDVDLHNKGLTKIPLKFGKVGGDFSGYESGLISLKGGPIEVGGDFWCWKNNLTSLEGSPKRVGGDFNFSENQISNLVGGPEVVIGSYNGNKNLINSFEGFPDDYDSAWLNSQGVVQFYQNPVQKILWQFPEELWIKTIHLINDYDAIWNGEVVEERLEMVKEKLGLV